MNGNALLEMLLALPLAALFLFTATDLGLNFLENAKVSDLIRSGFREEVQVMRDIGGWQGISAVSQRIEARLSVELQTAKRGLGFEQNEFLVEVAAVSIGVSAETGELLVQDIRIAPIARSRPLPKEVAPFTVRDVRSFVNQQLVKEIGLRPSSFAVPQGAGRLAREMRQLFVDRAVFFFISVKTLSNAVNQVYAETVFGRKHRVEQIRLLPVRNVTR